MPEKMMIAFGIERDDVKTIASKPLSERVPSKSCRFLEVPVPRPERDEVIVKVKTAGLNFNSIWSSICHPMDPFSLINGHVRRNPADKSHLQNFAILGSDAAGIIVEVGPDVKQWKEGDEVVVHCNVVNSEEIEKYQDSMLAPSQSIWGYETNYGAFAEYTKVKASQLLKKPATLSWEHAGSYCLTLATAYRMLLSDKGAKLKKGQTCLIWGAAGGLGAFAVQLARHYGAIPVGVVSTQEKADYCRSLGCDYVVDRTRFELPFIDSAGNPNYLGWKKFKNTLSNMGLQDLDVVFEHTGRDTLGLSVYLLRKGGRIVTCAATSGFLATIDLRYLWMELKTIIGSHFANREEAEEATRLLASSAIKPTLTKSFSFQELPTALDLAFSGQTMGKIGLRISD